MSCVPCNYTAHGQRTDTIYPVIIQFERVPRSSGPPEYQIQKTSDADSRSAPSQPARRAKRSQIHSYAPSLREAAANRKAQLLTFEFRYEVPT